MMSPTIQASDPMAPAAVLGVNPVVGAEHLHQRQDQPIDDLEAVLREGWADVLDLDDDDILPDSHFFELGGNSIGAAELVMLAKQHGVHLTRQMVFQAPIFADIVALASKSSESQKAADAATPAPFSLVSEEDVGLAREQCNVSAEEASTLIEDVYPTTALQAGLMARSISQPGVYVTSWVFHLENQPVLEPEYLSDVLGRVAEKLPILRTTMATSAEHGFVQVVLNRPPPIEVVRVNSVQELEPSSRRPTMGLGKPLVKIEIAVNEGEGNRLSVIWHSHHAVYDMTTLMLIARHVGDVLSGMESLPAPPSFAAFISHTLEVRRNPDWRNFWGEQLLDSPSPQFPHGEQLHCTDAIYTQPLAYGQGISKTTFTHANVFMAAWAYLLSCYEHSDDVVFGVTNGGRYAMVPGCADLVAPAIATIPMRVKLGKGTTVAEYLQRVSMLAVEASAWEQVGLSLIQDLGDDARRACGFRSLLNVQTTDAVGGGSDASRVLFLNPSDLDHVEPLDYALVLELSPRQGENIPLRISYDSRVMRRSQIVQIAKQLQQVVDFFLSSPDESLDKLGGDLGSARIQRYAAVACGIPQDALEHVAPCTALQAEALNVSLRHPTANMTRRVFACEGLHVEEVTKAWSALCEELPVLRSRFVPVTSASQNLQFLQATVEGPVEGTEAADLDEYLEKDIQTTFNLGESPVRLGLIRKASDDTVSSVVLTVHRAVLDCSDTQAEKMAEILTKAIDAAPLSRHTAQASTRQYLPNASEIEAARAFWAENLAGCTNPSFPEIPGAHTPLTSSSIYKETLLPASLGSLSDAVLQAAWALTVSQYYDSEDVIFGLGKRDPATHNDVMAFVPKRVTLDNLDLSALEFHSQVHDQTVKAAKHTHIGLAGIKTINDSTSAAGGFQNLLIIHEAASSLNNPESSAFRSVEHEGGVALSVYDYALVAEVTPLPAETKLKIRMSHDPAVLTRDQVRRFMSHYEHVLIQLVEAASSSSTLKLRDITHVSDAHLSELLEWNSNVPEPLERLVHELFEEKAALQPDEPAICARDGEWTLAELDQAAERLARWLRSLGVKPGKFVPLLFEKCGLTIVAMLGILKAGGASVALDPSHPPERLRGLIEAFGESCPLVLSSAQNRELAVGLEVAARAVVLDTNLLKHLSARPLPSLRMREDPAVTEKAEPSSHAFVLFTSGSTGKPKGILIPHRAFASSIRGHSKVLRYSTGPGSRNFQFTAYTSDVSIGEIFTSLAMGSCVCVPSDWDRQNNLAGSMRDLRVNWAFFTPSVATLLGPSEVPELRTLVFGGETASPENFQTWATSLYLINSFGPAECSIWTHCIPRPVVLSDFGSNIGYGVGDATWIVDPDDYNVLRPIGTVGEMLIEGPNVAEGYLNEPVKTANTFVWDPAWKPADRKRMRLYRTGDLARYLHNGMVQFLGRRDHQVKLNGLRVELNEIEHQIRRRISDDMLVAVDIVKPHGTSTTSAGILAAFIAPKEQTGRDNKTDFTGLLLREPDRRMAEEMNGLESGLAAALPSHMVPTVYLPLLEMPLTASAKTDRSILKKLAAMLPVEELARLGAAAAGKQARQEPGSVMERVIARLWTTALGRSIDLDVHDSFFKIGGDSLSAMRLVSLARREGIALSVEQVLKKPVLQDMAEAASMQPNQTLSELALVGAGSEQETEAIAFALLGDAPGVQTSAMQMASKQLGVDEADIEDIYPCTALQEGLLALSLNGNGSYVAQMVYELPANIDLKRFESAWDQVLQHWPILRTRFFEWHRSDGTSRLMQAVIAHQKLRWLRSRSLRDYLKLDQRDKMQPGDRMLRLAAFRDAKAKDGPHHFVMTIHHAVYDGWMLGLLLKAVRQAYAGLELPYVTPFQSFIAHVETRDAEQSQLFWKRYLDDAPRLAWPVLPGLDFRPRSSMACQRTVTLPYDVTRGAVSNNTPTTWMRAALAILLSAYSDANDIVFASTLYGRAVVLGQGSAENVAGPTLATVPVRVRVPREMQVSDLLASVQDDAASMLAHEQEGMQNIRSINREALATLDAQVLLVVQVDDDLVTGAANGTSADELMIRPKADSALENGFLSSALVIEATVSGNNLHLVATYDDRIIKTRGAERFIEQLSHVASQLCEAGNPDKASLTISELDLITTEDNDELTQWNSNVPMPAQALVHELFKARAASQPDAEALVSWEGSLTYSRLDDLSNRLAAHLSTQCGVKSGMHVPLVFEKSMWAVVAMLAVLKVGAAFAAMDPAKSADTLRDLASGIDAGFVLCSEKFRDLAPQMGLPTFCVGPTACFGKDGLAQVQDAVLGTSTPDQKAFFLFTSGSTGKPKAIVIDHTAFTSSIRGHGETLCYNQGGRNLQFTAYTSDVSMGEIFTSLSRGATVCIPSDDERMDDLAGAMERMRVDWAFLTPSVASLLDPDRVPTLRTLVFGGETATVSNVKTWSPRLHLINSFGPAETSIWSHAHPHFRENDDGSDIGWSLGCATWIVDPDNYARRMPIGAIGELMVEGPNVAAYYYNNLAKTQAAFLTGAQLPWLPAERQNNRVYRMGDLARWMHDGRVQFLGRRDAQVKLHGLKVDIGEVENTLRAALEDNMAEVAVELIRNPKRAELSYLVAFLSCTPADQPQDRENPAIAQDEEMLSRFATRTDGLRGKLASRLATFMVPSYFVPLTAMPLSASAKTDRKRLRALVADADTFTRLTHFSLAAQREVKPPSSREEKLLHGIWCSVLALDPRDFGVEADFFECGGDSIAAMKMASLARAAGFGLSVQEIYERPILGDLAGQLTSLDAGMRQEDVIQPFALLPSSISNHKDGLVDKAAEVSGVSAADVVDIYPCTPTQRSIVERTKVHPGAWWLHNVFDIQDGIDLPRLERAWHRVVETYDMLRTRIVDHEGHILQAVLRAPDSISKKQDETMSLEAFLNADMNGLRSMQSLDGQPLVRAFMLNDKHFILTLHHSAYDVWSMTNIYTLFEQLYLTDDSSTAVPMEQHSGPQFKYFVKAVLGQDQTRATEFWNTSLAKLETKPFTQPTDQYIASNRLLRHRIEVSESSLSDTTARRLAVTHAEMVYAAVALALHRQLQTPDTVVQLVSTGRTTPGVPRITELVGPTVASVPLRIHHRDSSRLSEYLTTVRGQLRGAAPFEQFGFDAACDLLQNGDNAAEQACRAAPRVVVHPQDPYAEQPAAKMGLQRRQLSAFTDDGASFTVDVSLATQGKALQALDVRIVFDDRVVEEPRLRLLLAELDVVVQRIMSGDYMDKDVAALLDISTVKETVAKVAEDVALARKEHA